ncbi:hypothetical protein SY89_03078 [Halolamina pelagica]|uniref:LexA-binding, inner membrane-associated hydrolase n=1 Tax=Halolamina pelagica TaxID=699431 RepID=A0A0P7I5L2_9EURY|nr:metal-dependent hydrolase [Halolamina pelagica]KPN32310.1 hypothetical protein SY89_03078 [Halolamina pelagica]
MLPWGHAAVGYLSYRLYTFLRRRRPPKGVAVVALAIGTQFPDLVDKPLSWTVGILPSGRSLAHSLLVLGLVAGLLYRVSRGRSDRTRTAVFAFGFGWLAHVFADGYTILLGQPTCVNYLVWPLAICPYDEVDRSIIEHLLATDLTTGTLIGLALTAIASAVWVLDGAPGLWYLLRLVKERLGWQEQPVNP